jgi:hypothetical protein
MGEKDLGLEPGRIDAGAGEAALGPLENPQGGPGLGHSEHIPCARVANRLAALLLACAAASRQPAVILAGKEGAGRRLVALGAAASQGFSAQLIRSTGRRSRAPAGAPRR